MGSEVRAFFEEHGWVIIRNAVPPERVALLERGFDRMFPAAGAPVDALAQIKNLARYHDPFVEWIRRDAGAHVAEVLGCESVRLIMDSLVLKPPGLGGRVEWHQDFGYLAFLKGARAAAVRLSLSPCTVSTGCVHVIDRSHTWGLVGKARDTGSKVRDDLPADALAGGSVPLELQPGDLSIHHCLTFHGSFENTSDVARKTIIVHAFDASTVLDPAFVPPGHIGQFPTDHLGRLTGATYPVIHGKKW